jgi:type II secretory pathway component PulF
MKYLEDAPYLVLLAVLMPLLIVLVWVALIIIMARRTYWWMRGPSTGLTRRRARRRRFLAELWSWLRGGVPPRESPEAAIDLIRPAALY